MLDIAIDLETMGRRSNSPIVSIGAVEFDLKTGQLGDTFYRTIDLEDSVREGCVMDPGTVTWWLKQHPIAQEAMLKNRQPMRSVLDDFRAWVTAPAARGKDARVWGNDPSFDNAILSGNYALLGQDPPWAFWNNRCVRTLLAMHPGVPKPAREGTHHNALDDAVYQAQCMLNIGIQIRAAMAAQKAAA